MKKEKVMSFISTLGILILLIGIAVSFISVFFNKMMPGRIISPDFPPFYLFFIGIVIFVFGFLLFFWEKKIK